MQADQVIIPHFNGWEQQAVLKKDRPLPAHRRFELVVVEAVFQAVAMNRTAALVPIQKDAPSVPHLRSCILTPCVILIGYVFTRESLIARDADIGF